MRRRRGRGGHSHRPQLFGKTLFVDLLLTQLAIMLFLLLLSSAMMREEQQEQKKAQAALTVEGEYVVIVDWPDANVNDVDLYVRNPAGHIVFFDGNEAGLMHLEYDDKGLSGDQMRVNGKVYGVSKNEERVYLRAVLPGEYVVNVHLFKKRQDVDTPVTVRLVKLKGSDNEVVTRALTLKGEGDEQTAFRFVFDESEKVVEINELDVDFVRDARTQPGGRP